MLIVYSVREACEYQVAGHKVSRDHSTVSGRTGYPLHRVNREKGENGQIKWPKHRKNTGNLVYSTCKFPDSKGKRYFYLPRKFLF